MSGLLARLRREDGATMIFVATALPAFVAFGIFVIDVGNWWVHKRHLQIQADAAALAGAREFTFPACSDQKVVEEAVDYSGGVLVDPDNNYAGFDDTPLEHNYQLAASARPQGPTEGIHTQVNTPDPWDRANAPPIDEDLASMAPGSRRPCSAGFLDVKMTETDIGGRFSPLRFLHTLGFVDYIDARARVELKALENASGLLPLGVEDVNPNRVHVWLYDEDTGKLLAEAELNRRDPEDGLLMYDNGVAGGGSPMVVDFRRETIDGADVTKQRVGVKVALSGSDSVTCGESLVLCYGTSADGLTRLRGHRAGEGLTAASCSDGVDNDLDGKVDGTDEECRGVRLGEVIFLKDAADCAANAYGAHDNGYHSTTCTAVDLKADVRGFDGTNAATLKRKVTATITSSAGSDDVDLAWNAASGRWEATGGEQVPLNLEAGTHRVDLKWEQTQPNTTLDMGGPTPATCTANKQSNPCKGTFANAHKALSGGRAISGPIKELRLDVEGITNVNNVPRCPANQTCPRAVVVRLGLAGRLALSDPDDPPVALRVTGEGFYTHSTQQLDCDPGYAQTQDELAYGCRPGYTINKGTPCLAPAALFASPNPPPWDCAQTKPGTMNSITKGVNERILCAPVNSADNCSNFGNPKACTNPNRYPGYAEGDPRIVTLFLVPFGSFAANGTYTVPVVDFAFFYITGWYGKGQGNENPCVSPPAGTTPDEFSPLAEPPDQGAISGYFIKYVAPNTGGSGTAPCDTSTIGGCVAVMTK